jgi:S1-C subfamily serine protease
MLFHKQLSMRNVILLTLLGGMFMGGVTGGVVGLYTAASISGNNYNVAPVARTPKVKEPVPSDKVAPAPVNEEQSLASMVKKVSPAVISIVISKEVAAAQPNGLFNFGPFSFDMGGNAGENTNTPKQKQEVGSGSGFIISSDGLVVTNRHVVEDAAATYTVVFSDGSKHDAKVLARDTAIDLALLKIDGKNLPTLSLGDSDSLQLGQTVVAIGNALGEFSNSVTRGIVSGINRKITAGGTMGGSEVIDQAIQTDAAINPGNSGGPLLNLDGQVIGVNTAVSQQGQSVGFAIPINIAKQSIDSVKKFGRIIRPYLGVRYVILNSDIAKQNQLPFAYGALVSRGAGAGQVAIIPGSPADKAGIMENDIILEADGIKIDENHTLVSAIIKKKVGDTISFKVYHKGDTKTVTVNLAEAPQQQ